MLGTELIKGKQQDMKQEGQNRKIKKVLIIVLKLNAKYTVDNIGRSFKQVQVI